MILLLSPFAPHVMEELWERSGGKNSVFEEAWPSYDEEKLVADMVTMAVQVNGKVRGEIRVPAEAGKDEIEKSALASDNIRRHTEGKDLVKTIVVPGRLINIVVREK